MVASSKSRRRKPSKRDALEWGRETYLRYPRRADRDELAAARRLSKRLHHPFVQTATTDDGFDEYLAGAKRGEQRRTLVCRTSDGAIAGFINFNVISRGALQSAYLGYGAYEPYAGTGMMREGLSLALRFGFKSLGLHRVEANIQIANERSVRLVTRAGFRLEGFSPRYLKVNGRWRDHLRFAMLAEEWKSIPR